MPSAKSSSSAISVHALVKACDYRSVSKQLTQRYQMEIVKGKRAFEHAQNVQIQIILRLRKVSSGTLPL